MLRFLAGLSLGLALLLVLTAHFMSEENGKSKPPPIMVSKSRGSSLQDIQKFKRASSNPRIHHEARQKMDLKTSRQEKLSSDLAESRGIPFKEKHLVESKGLSNRDGTLLSRKMAEEKVDPLGEAEEALLSLEKYFK